MYIWDYSNTTLKVKQYKQKTSSKSYKTQIKILTNPWLAQSGFDQPSPVIHCLNTKFPVPGLLPLLKFTWKSWRYFNHWLITDSLVYQLKEKKSLVEYSDTGMLLLKVFGESQNTRNEGAEWKVAL